MPSRTTSLSLALLLAAACRSAPPSDIVESELPSQPEHPNTKPEHQPATELACSVTLGPDGVLAVDGQPTPLQVPTTATPRVRSFPLRDDAILLAVGSETPWWPFLAEYPSDTLWELSCAAPSQLQIYGRIGGADFSWAELDRDGTGLYFSLGAVHRYDFAQRDHGPITTPPRMDPCWMNEPQQASDLVAGWIGDDRLLIYWGGPCGFEAEWAGGTAVIEDPRGLAKRRPSAFVGSIAADSSRRVWVGDGGRCNEPHTVLDRGTPGIWRSDDLGSNWTFLPIPALAEHAHGIEAIWQTADAPNRVWVQAECCYAGAADGCLGGERLYTDDGGQSWQLVDRGGQPRPTPPASRTIQLEGWLLEATLDGVMRRPVDDEAAIEWVLMPGL